MVPLVFSQQLFFFPPSHLIITKSYLFGKKERRQHPWIDLPTGQGLTFFHISLNIFFSFSVCSGSRSLEQVPNCCFVPFVLFSDKILWRLCMHLLERWRSPSLLHCFCHLCNVSACFVRHGRASMTPCTKTYIPILLLKYCRLSRMCANLSLKRIH